jgi:hypothetical protein
MNYQFIYIGGIHNSYFFETNGGIIYEIKFKPTPYLFGNDVKEISKNLFEFAILVEYKPALKLPPRDKKIGATVVAIFIDFYFKKGNAVSIYICDSSDGKEFIRKKKFDQWFNEFNNETFLKIDEMIVDKNKNKFPISLIISKSNPKRAIIIDAFIKIAMNHSK